MRMARMIIAASLAALLGVMAPVSARKADTQKAAEDKTTSSASCHIYQQAADGTWTEHPCAEVGGSTQHRPAPKSQEEDPR
jgi:hypothetical protein